MYKTIRFWMAVATVLALPLWVQAADEPRNGTIQALNQDSGTITISGQVLAYSETRTEIFLNGRPLSSDKLDTGMVVRYISDANVIIRIELLGPADKLALLEQH